MGIGYLYVQRVNCGWLKIMISRQILGSYPLIEYRHLCMVQMTIWYSFDFNVFVTEIVNLTSEQEVWLLSISDGKVIGSVTNINYEIVERNGITCLDLLGDIEFDIALADNGVPQFTVNFNYIHGTQYDRLFGLLGYHFFVGSIRSVVLN